MAVVANLMLAVVLLFSGEMKRWSQGLMLHQGLVDCTRAILLLPLAKSIYYCEAVAKCSLVETAFLLLVTASMVNLLTTVLNDTPIHPLDEDDSLTMFKESPQCVGFGVFMIWFSSITINLGPTFLSGALAAHADDQIREPSCPIIQGPFRHYILNLLWILINLLCIFLTIYHLRKLYRDFTGCSAETAKLVNFFTPILNHNQGEGGPESMQNMEKYIAKIERDGIRRVRMFTVITLAYIMFWSPVFIITLLNPGWEWKEARKSMAHEVSLHIAFSHSFANPLILLTLHSGLREAGLNLLSCICCSARGGNEPPIENPLPMSQRQSHHLLSV
ncbi:uncharacterized protein LOC111696958 [Eurytemora carolleeae]|uniref:uncharacterized protein LOC111696958 n=1 Tax=Eurytemora carolleeae TaxID=1294199 RepID=UPI000C755C80|nr:uncharacterized protein LOC111696958 [Eurytemora carolleeae]|eukprot:XP_023322544.1 uncharacterized protein LOC111696958 [Eurytemora affinis]